MLNKLFGGKKEELKGINHPAAATETASTEAEKEDAVLIEDDALPAAAPAGTSTTHASKARRGRRAADNVLDYDEDALAATAAAKEGHDASLFGLARIAVANFTGIGAKPTATDAPQARRAVSSAAPTINPFADVKPASVADLTAPADVPAAVAAKTALAAEVAEVERTLAETDLTYKTLVARATVVEAAPAVVSAAAEPVIAGRKKAKDAAGSAAAPSLPDITATVAATAAAMARENPNVSSAVLSQMLDVAFTTAIDAAAEVKAGKPKAQKAAAAAAAPVTSTAEPVTPKKATPASAAAAPPVATPVSTPAAAPAAKAAPAAPASVTPAASTRPLTKRAADLQAFHDAFEYAEAMPESAERDLIKLVAHFQIADKTKSKETLLIPDDIKKIYTHFKERLVLEELSSSTLTRILRIVDEKMGAPELDVKVLAREFLKALGDIQPLDIPLLSNLIPKTKLASDSITNQEVILLIGPTGAGKSTTIHFCAGAEMREIKLSDIRHIEPSVSLPGLETVTTSPSSRSETRHINPIKINALKAGSTLANKVIMVDTAGFGDTEGAAIDMANGKGVVDAVRKSKSVRPVIFISQNSLGARWKSLSGLAQTLTMFIDNIGDRLSSITYVFTQFGDADSAEIHGRLDDKLGNLTEDEEGDLALVALLKDMVDKTADGKALILNPLTDKPGEFLDRIVSTPAITDTKEAFQYFINPESLKTLSQQANKIQASVRNALKRSDFKLLEYKLGLLKMLATELDSEECKSAYTKCVAEVETHVKSLIREATANIEDATQDGNTSFETKVNKFKEIVKLLVEFEDIREKHLSGRTEIGSLSETCSDLVKKTQHTLFERIRATPTSSFFAAVTTERLAKMKMIASKFKGVSAALENYAVAKTYAQNAFNTRIENATSAAEKNDFNEYVLAMSNCSFAMSHWSEHLNMDQCNEKIEAPQDELKKVLKKLVISTRTTLAAVDIVDTNIDIVLISFEVINTFKNTSGISEYFDVALVSQAKELLIKACVKYFELVKAKVNDLSVNAGLAESSEINTHILNLMKMRKNSDILLATNDIFVAIVDIVKNAIAALKAHVLSTLQLISSNPGNVEELYGHLRDYLVTLKNATETFSEEVLGSYKRTFQEVSDEIEAYVRSLGDNLATADEAGSSELLELYVCERQLNALVTVCDGEPPIIPSIIEATAQINKSFENAILGKISNIKEMFVEKIADLKELRYSIFNEREYLIYLDIARLAPSREVVAKVQEVESLVSEFSDLYFAHINKKIADALSSVANTLTHPTLDVGKISREAETAVEIIRFSLVTLKTLEETYQSVMAEKDTLSMQVGSGNFATFFSNRGQKSLDAWCVASSQDNLVGLLSNLYDLSRPLVAGDAAEKQEMTMASLQTHMLVAQALVAVDSYLDVKPQTFAIVEVQFGARLREQKGSIKNKILMAAYRLDWDAVITLFSEFKNTDDFEKLIGETKVELLQTLTSKIDSLSERATELEMDLSGSETQLFDEFRRFSGFTQIKAYLDEMDVTSLSESLEGIKRSLFGKLIYLISFVNEKLEANNFVEVENILKKVESLMVKYFNSAVDFELRKQFDVEIENYRIKISDRLETVKAQYAQVECHLVEMPRITNMGALFSYTPADNYYVKLVDSQPALVSGSSAAQGTSAPLPEAGSFELIYVAKAPRLWVRLDVNPEETTAEEELSNPLTSTTLPFPLSEQNLNAIANRTGHTHISLYFRTLVTKPVINLFEQLSQVSARDPSYSRTMEELKAFILYQVDLFLSQVKSCEPEIARSQTKYLDTLLKYLPTDVAGEVSLKITDCEKEIEEISSAEEREVNEAKSLGSIPKLIAMMKERQSKWRFAQARQIKLVIDNLIIAAATELKDKISKGEVLSALDKVSVHFPDWVSYGQAREYSRKTYPAYEKNYTDLVNTYTEEVVNELLSKIKIAYLQVEAFVNSINTRAKSGSPKSILNAFELLTEILKLARKSFKTSDLIYEITKRDAVLMIYSEQRIQDVAVYLIDNQDALIESLINQKQVPAKLMELIRDSDPLQAMILDCYQSNKNHHIFKDPVKKWEDVKEDPLARTVIVTPGDTLANKLENPRDYASAKRVFSMAVNTWKEEFIKGEITKAGQLKTPNPTERDKYYAGLFRNLTPLRNAQERREYLDTSIIDIDTAVSQCLDTLKSKLDQTTITALEHLELVFSSNNPEAQKQFYISYDSLRACRDNFEDETSIKDYANTKLTLIDATFSAKLNALKQAILDESDIQRIANLIVMLKTMAINIPAFKQRIDQAIEEALTAFTKKMGGGSTVAKIGVVLNNHADPVAQLVIAEHKAFQGYALSLRNEKTLKFGVDDVLAALKGDNVNKILLREQYITFETEYWRVVDLILTKYKDSLPPALAQIVSNTKQIADKEGRFVDKALHILSYVFSYWTVLNSGHYFKALDTADSGDTKNYLMQPHAAQVISILRLLGTDIEAGNFLSQLFSSRSNQDSEIILDKFIKNHFDQILSGQGKSVTLAAIAVTLALLGFDIAEACYSKYLSTRDYEAFKELFYAFQVNKHIQYGTFADLAEADLNKRGDIREIVLAMIRGEDVTKIIKSITDIRPTLFLGDEIDVFFSADIYGAAYNPIANLTDPTISALLRYIWNNRENDKAIRFSAIKKTSEYTNCSAKFSGWGKLIDQCIMSALVDLATFETADAPVYVVQDGRIGYKENDGISFNVSYGYKTLWAYFKEREKDKVNEATLESMIAFYINCGSFSYAEMPKHFRRILGVTGSLESTSDVQKAILANEYGVDKYTYTPSVFGASQLKFRGDNPEDVIIESAAGYYPAIFNEIKKRLTISTDGKPKRAVMVFFKSKAKLEEFYNSSAFRSMKDTVSVMTEETPHEQKVSLIAQAATTGKVILFTQDFARGTDFACLDKELDSNGGPHVLSTFVPENPADEYQMIHRTARMGGNGSVSFVLLDTDLEQFDITSSDINTMRSTGQYHSIIDKKRRKYFEREYPKTISHVNEIKAAHNKSMRFRQALLENDVDTARDFLVTDNTTVKYVEAVDEPSRIVVLMDATGSMALLLNAAKDKVDEMFKRAHEILKEAKFDGIFEVQFAAYRNYNAPAEKLLQCSGWHTDPAALKTFMSGVHPEFGINEEAMEVGLQKVNQWMDEGTKVHQVIVIGDVPPNSPEDVTRRRSQNWSGIGGDAYWATTDFKVATDSVREIQKLKDRNIPVHAYPVMSGAIDAFKEIAALTGGTSKFLDVNASGGAEELTHVVTTKILLSVGGAKHGALLVEAYERKFKARGHTAAPAAPAASSAPVVK